jgi:hypothetical protein
LTTREIVHVELSARDRTLILQFGYPFDRIESAVRAKESSTSVELVSLDRFELRRLIGDLSTSIKQSEDDRHRVELDDLIERLELSASGRISMF